MTRRDSFAGACYGHSQPNWSAEREMTHKFIIKQAVHHQPRGPLIDRSRNKYTIIALLPVESDGQCRYRIRSETENFERIVTENELSRIG
jgi:hypothetical protein